MTDLERRALLGDRQAQEECTEKRIVLGCPLCNGKVKVSTAGRLFHCRSCNFTLTFPARLSPLEAISRWNTRPAPPIGRCVECGAYTPEGNGLGYCSDGAAKTDDGYCDCFYPKGGEENAAVNAKGFLICPASGMEITDFDFCSYFEPKED